MTIVLNNSNAPVTIFVVSLLVLLWTLTWFGARDWNFEGRGLTPVFGASMVISGMAVFGSAAIIFVEGVIALV